jgi:hypothetical protein
MLYVILGHDAPAHGALIAKAFTRPRNRGNSSLENLNHPDEGSSITKMKGPAE